MSLNHGNKKPFKNFNDSNFIFLHCKNGHNHFVVYIVFKNIRNKWFN